MQMEEVNMADAKKNILTYAGLQELEAELEDLKVNKRKEVAQKIKEAREQGDLSENAEYDAAKDEQRDIEARIEDIEKLSLIHIYPEGTGIGGPGYSIKGEFTQNGFKNDLKHEPGVLSMARTMMPNSAGSQFFIMHQTSPHLDGQYAAFGKVIEGIEVVNKIADVATDRMDKPLEPQVMKKVTVETFGVDYQEPEKC